MLGVVNKAIEAFVCQRYGDKLWADLLIDLSLPGYEFEAMLTYEDGITYDLIDRLAKRQSKMHQDVLEDIGGYLVAKIAKRPSVACYVSVEQRLRIFCCPLTI